MQKKAQSPVFCQIPLLQTPLSPPNPKSVFFVKPEFHFSPGCDKGAPSCDEPVAAKGVLLSLSLAHKKLSFVLFAIYDFQPNDEIFFILVFSHLTVVPIAANHPITTSLFPPTVDSVTVSLLFLSRNLYSLENEQNPKDYLMTSPAGLSTYLQPPLPSPGQ